ncbi:hypothetical protein HUB98_05595 [Paenibacillus barcinonensis]|uniref:Uncharacterized protein n=1 Tax=Paenibacillus barcinonensis TaxID=198119 RepID=A0A2V4VEH1_PAEBA|nr:hypothetical protein [Paenibacillus barcinonensis]PYE51464.1 hypothetical protein DFQ00_102258 [Paenibacillus barcinonensis]QKS55855.1 hypothetical protein HUB98_05595 [Paenibacillus barcinonensis]
MANLNDSKILELKKQIEEKKKSVSKSKKFTPVTNCSIELDGVRINIQTLTKEQLISLLVKLNSYAASAIELELLDQYIISGYNIADWIGDLKSKLDFINSKDEEQKLKLMESKLDKLLSDDKKVELELNEIAEMLNS